MRDFSKVTHLINWQRWNLNKVSLSLVFLLLCFDTSMAPLRKPILLIDPMFSLALSPIQFSNFLFLQNVNKIDLWKTVMLDS